MELSSLFALPDGLEVTSTAVTGQILTLLLVATATTAMCPLCGYAATHIRSSYTRHVADVPDAGRQVQLILRVRKFRCDTTDCPRRVFFKLCGNTAPVVLEVRLMDCPMAGCVM